MGRGREVPDLGAMRFDEPGPWPRIMIRQISGYDAKTHRTPVPSRCRNALAALCRGPLRPSREDPRSVS